MLENVSTFDNTENIVFFIIYYFIRFLPASRVVFAIILIL